MRGSRTPPTKRELAEMMPNSDAMNALEAAAFLGVHVETLRKLARRNEIPSFKVGRDWRFRKEALVRWADEQRTVGAHCSVLVIDDEEQVCQALVRVVERLGCRARAATTGAEGLALVAREAPDLVLLDLLMPGMSGPQFLEELRMIQPELPVVVVTGYPDGELMAKAAQHAPLMMLSKPVDHVLLERTVRVVLGERQPASIRSEATHVAASIPSAREGKAHEHP